VTGVLALDWPIIAVSLFNAIVSLWLALTVILSAEHRNRGVYLAGAGLLASAVFFISHTAIVGGEIDPSGLGLDFWWHAGWLPVIEAPFGWYVLMLWYSGFWEASQRPVPAETAAPVQPSNFKHTIDNRLHKRHTPWLAAMVATLVILVGLAIFTIPSFAQAIYFDFSSMPTLRGVPILLLVYPAFIVMCIALALDALMHPGPSHRVLGDLARARSRPWLISASAALLAVSLLVTAAILWGISAIIRGQPIVLTADFVVTVAWFDLVAATMIGAAITLLGQAMVSYEVFTGKTLPRRGFFRNWIGAVLLAAATGVIAGGGLAAHLRPIYGLILSAVLMTTFYALFNWRSFVERDQFMTSLRPFVGGQGLIDQLVGSEQDPRARAGLMFQALCREVLASQAAYLLPLGSISSLIAAPLVYPANSQPEVALLEVDQLFPAADPGLISLPAELYPFRWAIPLWTERGLIGALLLANKLDGGLYTQEEIEVARASGEGIIDLLAGEEIVRRLMALQRRRLTEAQVMDRRARRTLHDDVLPGLHTALLEISALPRDNSAVQQAITTLTDAHRRIAGLIRNAAPAPASLGEGGLLPDAVSQMLHAEFTDEFDDIDLRVEGAVRPLDALLNEVVFNAAREAIRNAALHGRHGSGPLNLAVVIVYADGLTLTIADDGVGLEADLPDSEFPSGSQGGLALHTTLMALIGGSLTLQPGASSGTCVTLKLPLPAAPDEL